MTLIFLRSIEDALCSEIIRLIRIDQNEIACIIFIFGKAYSFCLEQKFLKPQNLETDDAVGDAADPVAEPRMRKRPEDPAKRPAIAKMSDLTRREEDAKDSEETSMIQKTHLRLILSSLR